MAHPIFRARATASFLIGVLLAAIAVEAGLKGIKATPLWRALPVVEPVLGRPDPETGYTFTPGTSGIWVRENRAPVTINSLGLRDEEMAAVKPEGTSRVGLLGNSVTEALQVEHAATFEELAERHLAVAGHNVEFVNLAMSGNGPLRQLVRLETAGRNLDLDVVLAIMPVGDFLSGELLDDRLHPGYVRAPDGSLQRGYAFKQRAAIRHAQTWWGQASLWAIQDVELVRLIYLRSRESLRSILGLPDVRAEPVVPGPSVEKCQLPFLNDLAAFWLGGYPTRYREAADRVLHEFGDYARNEGLPVMLALTDIPVPPPGCAEQHALRSQVVKQISMQITAQGLQFLDITEALSRIAADPTDLVGFGRQRGGGHLNFDGHSAYAALIAIAITPMLDGRPSSGAATISETPVRTER